MKSLILTLLYLAKDTIHRWFTRLSSPLARVLVVYFLTLCALSCLGSYAISTKIVRDKIIREGANIVGATLIAPGNAPFLVPSQKEIKDALGADSYILQNVGAARLTSGRAINVYTCQFSRLNQMMPLLATSGKPTLLQSTDKSTLPPGPSEVTMQDTLIDIYVRNLPPTHPLLRTMLGSGLIIQPDSLPIEYRGQLGRTNIIALIFEDLESSEPIEKAEKFFHTYMQMEGLRGTVHSALHLLKEMDLVLGKQTQCRIAFCIGISSIVGILLTALAGMEYRQNEYIYTLMKSFGIHPLLLVGSFITENLLIVGASFIGAIATFMYFQRLIVTQILKLGNYTLSFQEITPEIALITYTLLGCVLISAIPIFVAANRAIGRVLK